MGRIKKLKNSKKSKPKIITLKPTGYINTHMREVGELVQEDDWAFGVIVHSSDDDNPVGKFKVYRKEYWKRV